MVAFLKTPFIASLSKTAEFPIKEKGPNDKTVTANLQVEAIEN